MIDAEVTDRELIDRFRDGDWPAGGALYERHYPKAYRFACRLAGKQDADDVTAAAFERVFGALSRGHGPRDDFWGYLVTTARSAHIDLMRGRSRELLTLDGLDVDERYGFVPERTFDPAEGYDDADLAIRALKRLPRTWQQVLWYANVEDRPLEEVAELVGTNPNAVRVMAFRAREGLRVAVLAEHMPPTASHHNKIAALIPKWTRGSLTASLATAVDNHMEGCAECRKAATDLDVVNRAFRFGALAPM